MLTVTVEIDAPAGMGQGAKEAVAMRLESLGGVRVLDVRETDGQMKLSQFGAPAGRPAAAPAPGPVSPSLPAAPPRKAKEPMRSCFNCAARFGDARLIEGKLAYGACRINRQAVRDLRGVCKQWSERR